MSLKRLSVLILFAMLVLSVLANGNQKANSNNQRSEITALKVKVSELEDKVKKLEIQVENMLKPKLHRIDEE